MKWLRPWHLNYSSYSSKCAPWLSVSEEINESKHASNLNSLFRSILCVSGRVGGEGDPGPGFEKQERGNCSQQHNAINGNVLFFAAVAGTAPPLSQREHFQLWHHRRHRNKLDGLALPNDVYHLMCTRWDLITFPRHGVKLSVYPWAEANASVESPLLTLPGKERTFSSFQPIKNPDNEK